MIRYLTEEEVVFINFLMSKKYSQEEQIGVKDPFLNSTINVQNKVHLERKHTPQFG